jgi:hypothetical protein
MLNHERGPECIEKTAYCEECNTKYGYDPRWDDPNARSLCGDCITEAEEQAKAEDEGICSCPQCGDLVADNRYQGFCSPDHKEVGEDGAEKEVRLEFSQALRLTHQLDDDGSTFNSFWFFD